MHQQRIHKQLGHKSVFFVEIKRTRLKDATKTKLIFYIAALSAVALVSASYWWRANAERNTIYEIALTQADAHLEQDLLYRKWAAGHGGVYAPITEETPPNEYLKDNPERDVQLPSGKMLTLLNPAYMTRQVHELAAKKFGVQAHITSLNPIRKQNAPDTWEVAALKSFETGNTAMFALDSLRGAPYFRRMRPLIAEQSCLKCHQQQGYKEGDIRGGISVSVPAGPYLEIITQKSVQSAIFHIVVLLSILGLLAAFYFAAKAKLVSESKIRQQLQSHAEILHKHNEEYQSINESLRVKNDEFKRLAEDYAQQNQILDHARKKAEENDRLKTAFLCNMSHEIRTPMNGIVGFAQLLSSPDIDPRKHKQYLDILNDSCEQLLEVVNDILEISKIETGQIEINQQPVYLPSLLSDLAESWKRKASAKNNAISIIESNEPEKLWVFTDELKLNHLLGHLISNAVKFTEFGSIVLSCGIEKDRFYLSVSDTGIGIPSDMHEVIFDRFRKAESPQTYNYGGTGLGLAISKGYADNMGGRITLVSAEGKGSTFSYSQPYQYADIDGLTMVEDTAQDEIKLAGAVVLVAEDEQNNFIYILELLEAEGCIVHHAANGAEAVRIIEEFPEVDIVLMDINMPVMNGYEATSRIQSLRPSLPIIAQTALLSETEMKQFISAGFKTIISKPISKERLIAAIKQYIQS